MYSYETLRQLNCNHDINKYFDINTKWSKDDYCLSCLKTIEDIEQKHNQNE